MEVPADKVVWPLVYKDIGNDPALLLCQYGEEKHCRREFTLKTTVLRGGIRLHRRSD